MKSLFKVSLLAAVVMMAAGCQTEETKATSTTAEQKVESEKATQSTAHFDSDNDKVAYAIGLSLANYLNTNLDKPKEYGIDLNKELVLKGIEHAFADKAELTDEDVRATLSDFDKRLKTLATEKAKEKAEASKKAGDEFRAKFEKEKGVKKTESGLLYQVLEKGKGKSPKATDTVQVHYKGTLIDGTQFDSSYDRGQPATFPLDRVIKGWTEGVQLMTVGSKYKFVIPPELAYGDRDTPTIPANSTLVFEVELLKVEKAEDKAKSKPKK
ncbi:FKBP-type peptidyl-prolyl cis-trans isomerase FkpA precursor [Vibrio aerogenes CECT 7868]|uniref:Peptidyl-prolyl cis-trans isomerase n=1 Tax=Vibrio aerogenes CECT 7868 TaxID=1216006 RepID=A0A1M6E9D5_9VIBR|nr:FKBP-type peptidyl-prolyl cis-trans isomerase [Vibrio aerogenes]SHI82134.1 FKBP-type peptidyl-prolyl cis-trans isomerase FkpA precursor [Vibrio aerogenes CECT 7868]